MIAWNEGRKEDAEKYLKEATKVDPASHAAHYSLGLVYQKEGRTEEARAAFQKALECKPDDKDAQDALKSLDSQ